MNNNHNKTVKKTFWGAVLFYFLIAFEFAYMAGPFAVYFYSVYSPVLNFFNKSPLLAGIISFFLPHTVRETSSVFINIHEILGFAVAIIGFIGFCIGACQVYYHKLAKKGAVTGGIYNYIRHPQYVCFMTCSFGLLLVWPRYIVLFMFVTMLFAYYLLARAEEKECEQKFGQVYLDYKNKTNMFLPFKLPFLKKLPSLPQNTVKRMFVMVGIYLFTLTITISIAMGINYLSINSLYSYYDNNSANISLCKIEEDKLKALLSIALENEEVKERFEKAGINQNTRLLNYLLPTEWYAAEIPMNNLKYRAGHLSPSNYDKNLYKIIFTKAEIRANKAVDGKSIIKNVAKRTGIVEVWVNYEEQEVIKIAELPSKAKYENVPVAIY